jgi:hypothetical protein
VFELIFNDTTNINSSRKGKQEVRALLIELRNFNICPLSDAIRACQSHSRTWLCWRGEKVERSRWREIKASLKSLHLSLGLIFDATK